LGIDRQQMVDVWQHRNPARAAIAAADLIENLGSHIIACEVMPLATTKAPF
jgi:hypothetical protein